MKKNVRFIVVLLFVVFNLFFFTKDMHKMNMQFYYLVVVEAEESQQKIRCMLNMR